MAIYGDGTLYGSGSFYGPSDVDVLTNLSFYRTSQTNVYVFHWGFSPIIINPDLFTFDYELQLDTVPTFNSPNLVDFTSSNVITYQNGNVRKGYAVPVAERIDNVEQVWYAQVRIVNGLTYGPWSFPLIWTIPAKQQEQFAVNLMESLPDYHVYGKGDLLKPQNQRNSNLYLVDNMYGNQLDAASYINFLTLSSNYIDLCLDEVLQDNFGVLFNFTKPTSMTFVDYRWILTQLILASLEGSTNAAISRVVAAFTGVPPNLIDVRNANDFFLNTIQDPPIVPTVAQSVFYTSYPYVAGTLAVEDLTNGEFVDPAGINPPGPGYTTNPVQGTWTMNVATTHTLQATFNVGTVNDPFPVVFDGIDYTVLSGTATFTNNSNLVTGVGTFFTTQCLPNPPALIAQITDTQGIYVGTVASITDNTHLVLTEPWFGPTETVGFYKLTYTDIQLPPPINWAAQTLAWGLIIQVLNPGEFILDDSLIETIGSGILPAAAKVYWEFPS